MIVGYKVLFGVLVFAVILITARIAAVRAGNKIEELPTLCWLDAGVGLMAMSYLSRIVDFAHGRPVSLVGAAFCLGGIAALLTGWFELSKMAALRSAPKDDAGK